MRGRHSSALSSGQGRGIDSSYLSGDDSTTEHVDSGALHHCQYTPELSADTPSHVPSSYASPDPPNIIRPSEPRVVLRLRGTEPSVPPPPAYTAAPPPDSSAPQENNDDDDDDDDDADDDLYLLSMEAVDMIWFEFDGFGYMQQNSAEKNQKYRGITEGKDRCAEGLPRDRRGKRPVILQIYRGITDG
ncbi:hypothetical protein Dimus_008491 [Dionaea muscipula]